MPRKSKERHFGQRIAAIRLHRGLSQGAVSRRTGIDPSYLSRLETGRVQPTVGTAMKIGGALRATPNDMFGPTPPERKDQPCPVSRSGRCLLDLLDKGDALPAGITPESYTTRQIRLLRRFMWFLSHCGPDVLKSLDVLSAEMVENGGKRRRA
jgi:transcriptional regulator with XRE-family HTH domain